MLTQSAEFAEKGSIAGYIRARKGKPERERALKWASEIAEGLSHACTHVHSSQYDSLSFRYAVPP